MDEDTLHDKTALMGRAIVVFEKTASQLGTIEATRLSNLEGRLLYGALNIA